MQKVNKASVVLASILALGISSNAFAQKATSDIKDAKFALTDKTLELNEKKNELSAFVFFMQPTNPSGQESTTMIDLGYGRRLGQRFVLAGHLNLMIGSGNTSEALGIGAKYYFKVGKKGDFVPFAQAGINVTLGQSTSSDTFGVMLEVGPGAAIFITETASIDMRVLYQTGTTTMTSGSYSSSYSSSTIIGMFGLTQRF